ncbi:hypothetical protein T458_17100 [Brevibacillus panacihumi W25]|uniref:Uncharacterized protein n=1 Tax=Brevibacillus panacihumi W25 TaxID=1408254 RepID=V6M689_9BACL|nr:hypothetical protein T458_17100 [Brevibacillus panacihumi W25]
MSCFSPLFASLAILLSRRYFFRFCTLFFAVCLFLHMLETKKKGGFSQTPNEYPFYLYLKKEAMIDEQDVPTH